VSILCRFFVADFGGCHDTRVVMGGMYGHARDR
jgi:hypothetical protein